jgi:hypothetical protein
MGVELPSIDNVIARQNVEKKHERWSKYMKVYDACTYEYSIIETNYNLLMKLNLNMLSRNSQTLKILSSLEETMTQTSREGLCSL